MLKEEPGCLCVKLTDFGLAKNFEEAGLSGITASFCGIGTPHYMAPEQLNNARDVDLRADIYSLGATIYKMLTNHMPYEHSANDNELMYNIFSSDPIHICELNPNVPENLANTVMQCLKNKLKQRTQSVQQLRNNLFGTFGV